MEKGLAKALKKYNPDYSAKDLAHALLEEFPESPLLISGLPKELDGEALAEALKVYKKDYSAEDLADALVWGFLELDGEGLAKDLLAEALKVYKKDYSAEDLAEGLAKALKVYREDYSAKDLAHVLVEKFEELDGEGLAKALKVYKKDYSAEDLAEALKVYKKDYSAEDLAHALVGQFPELKGEGLAEVLKFYNPNYSAEDLAHVLVEKFEELDGEGLAKALKVYREDYSAKDLAHVLVEKFEELDGEGLAEVLKFYNPNYSAEDLAHVLVEKFEELDGEGLAEVLKFYNPNYSAEDLAHALVGQFPGLDPQLDPKIDDKGLLAGALNVYNPGYSAKDLAHALVGQFPELKGEDLANVLKVYKEDYSAKDLAEGLAKALKAHKADSAKDLAEGLAKVLKAYKADHPVKDLADVLVVEFPELKGKDLAKVLKAYGKGNISDFKDYENALALEFGKMGVQDRISMLQSAFPDKLREILEDLMKPKLSPLSRAEMIKNVDIDDQDLYQLVKVIINKQSDQLELVAEAIATVKPHLETNTLLEAIFRSFSKNPEDTSVKTYEKQESKIIICAIAIEKAKAKAVEEEPPTKEYLTKVALQFFKHKKLYMDDDFINKKKLTSIIKSLQSNIDIGRDLSSSKSYESVRREADSLISFRKNEGCEVTDILTAEIMKDMSTHTPKTEKIVREELEKAQKGEQEQTKKEEQEQTNEEEQEQTNEGEQEQTNEGEQEGQQSKPSASVKHPQCMTHRINNQCELARLMMRCK